MYTKHLLFFCINILSSMLCLSTQDLPEKEEIYAQTKKIVADGTPKINEFLAQDVNFSFFNNPFALEAFNTSEVEAKCSGYLQYAGWWANRQSIGDSDAAEVLFGAKPVFDPDCKDINAQGEFDMIILDSRLRCELFGPKVIGAKLFGFIEIDAFGDMETVLRFRIWHAFFRLNWQKHKLLLGQFWHPFSVVNTFPPTITTDNGSPVTPNSRNPQISYTYTRNKTQLMFSLLSQQQFASTGPEGESSIYLRNTQIPMIAMRLVYDAPKKLYAGASILFQRLKPRLESDTGYRVHEAINSMQATIFATIDFDPLEIRQQLTFVQNGNNLTMLSGFAVTCIDPVTDMRTYTNINALSYWIDININRSIEPGVYMGIIKNLGARKDIIPCIKDASGLEIPTIYGLANDIDSVFKIFPRIRFHVIPIDFAFELEYTRSTYGCINNKGRVKNPDPAHHIRAMFASYYYF